MVFATISLSTLKAQAPNYLWVQGPGGASNDYGESVSTDASGNVYITGSFGSPTITFGSFTLTNADISGITADLFIVKYNPSGTALWARSVGGLSDDKGKGISVDLAGNLLVTGFFKSTSITFGTFTVINAGNNDVFIAKYDASGNALWANGFGGTGDDGTYSVSTDDANNVFVAGYFRSPTIAIGSTTLTNASTNQDVLVAKFDISGNAIWAKSAGGSLHDWGQSVICDETGNVIITGNYYSTSITFGSTTLANAGTVDLFIVKYDNAGNVLWAKKYGGAAGDYGYGVSTDLNNNVLVTGIFASSTITFGTTTLTNAGLYDMYIAKFDSLGNNIWANGAGGASYDWGFRVANDASGNSYIIGSYMSSTITLGSTTLTNVGSTSVTDVFFTKIDPSGNFIWAKSAGSTSNDNGNGICLDPSGNILITGDFGTPSITFGATTLTSLGGADVFLTKLDFATGLVGDSELKNNILIYPNPTNGIFSVDWNQDISGIEIYTILGKKIYSAAPLDHSNQLIINLSEQPSGIYFVNLFSAKGNTIKKLSINK